jgi:tetratricopeptide (TPR) repeat protein
MSIEEARRLLELSRQAHWSFPTSFGRPIPWDNPGDWVDNMGRERNSFTQAMAFLIHRGEGDMALQIAANVWRLWIPAKDEQGGRNVLAQVLAEGSRKPTKARALALYGYSLLAMRLGKTNESRKASEEAFGTAKRIGDPEALVLANLALSRVAFEDGDYAQSLSRAKDARQLAHSLGPAFEQAPLFMEAQSTRMLGDYERAASLFRRSVELNRRIGDRGMVIAELNNLGLVEIHRDHVVAAEQLFEESERASSQKDGNPYGEGMVLLNKAMVAFRRGHVREARSLLLRAKETFERSGVEPASDDKSEIDWLDQELARANPQS